MDLSVMLFLVSMCFFLHVSFFSGCHALAIYGWGAQFSQPSDGMESLGISPVKESKCGIYEHEDLTTFW